MPAMSATLAIMAGWNEAGGPLCLQRGQKRRHDG
jgi:hypothetical protein